MFRCARHLRGLNVESNNPTHGCRLLKRAAGNRSPQIAAVAFRRSARGCLLGGCAHTGATCAHRLFPSSTPPPTFVLGASTPLTPAGEWSKVRLQVG